MSKFSQNLLMFGVAIFAVFYALLALDISRDFASMVGNDQIESARTQVMQRAESGAPLNEAVHSLQDSPVWYWLMAKVTTPAFIYGEQSLWGTMLYYIRMPDTHKIVLMFHTSLGGLCLLMGVAQFWPALRRSKRAWHRHIGKAYAACCALSMVFAATYLSLTGPDDIYSGLTFYLGLWGLVAITSVSLGMSIYHVKRGEIAQHQGWMAVNFGCLASAPVTRLDWGLLGVFFPSLSMNEANYAFMILVYGHSFLIGYGLFCLNRLSQREQTQPISPDQHIGWRVLAVAFMGLIGGTTLSHFFGSIGLEHSEAARALVPQSVIVNEQQTVAGPLGWSIAAFCASNILTLTIGAVLTLQAFGRPVARRDEPGVRRWALLMAVASAFGGLMQMLWGMDLGAPGFKTLTGGTGPVFNGVVMLFFALALAGATRRASLPWVKEFAVFVIACTAMTPSAYWTLDGLHAMGGLSQAHLAEGHAFISAQAIGGVMLLWAMIYSIYGQATRSRFAS